MGIDNTIRRRRTRARLRLAVVAVVGGLTLQACSRNPVTGNREFTLISESQEIQMGQQYSQQVEQSLGLVENEALQRYVERIGLDLARESERPNLPWRFRVVEDPTPNAFALPGGFIYVTRGLLTLMDSEAELATVLGHEIGHVTARHSVSQLSKAQLAQIGLGVGSILFPQAAQVAGGVAGAGLQLLFLKYGRDDERQADELGFKYAIRENYDVREADDIFRSLQRFGEGSGRSPVPAWAATHPGSEERIEAMQERVAALTQPQTNPRSGVATFLGMLDNMVYGENPRQGFFRDGVFYHPDMRFQVSYPQGWKTQNMPQAVVAVSPQQDAMIQLELAQGSAQQAAREFFSGQGLQSRDVRQQTINGAPAVVGEFQAQTQQGAVQGVVGFIEHGGRTFRILGYSPAQRFSSYRRLFGQVIGSFDGVSDPSIINTQPNRVDIVKTDRTMTLAQFNTRYPSVIPIDELALINQVEGANSTIPSGTSLKRIVRG